jgi:hypothetical protein
MRKENEQNLLVSEFSKMSRAAVLLHRQRSPEDRQLLRAWYKIRDMLLGQNCVDQDISKALKLASVCSHPLAVWLTKLFDGHDAASLEEARQVFLGCENRDARSRFFGALLGGTFDDILRAAELGDAFAQARVAGRTYGEERFRWAEKSAARGERDGFYYLGDCDRHGIGCKKDVEKAKGSFLVAAEVGHVRTMVCLGVLLDKDDPQRFVWLGRAASNGVPDSFLNEMSDQVCNFDNGSGHANVVFVIGRALKGHINNEERTIFGNGENFVTYIGPANRALHFYNFQLRSYRKAVDSWTSIGLKYRVVKDIRKMIGTMIWDAREEAAYTEEK